MNINAFLLYLENEELRKEFAVLANEMGDYLDQKAAILANSGLQSGSLEVCSKHCSIILMVKNDKFYKNYPFIIFVNFVNNYSTNIYR